MRTKRDNRSSGPNTGNPPGAKVVNTIQVSDTSEPQVDPMEAMLDAALGPSAATRKPGETLSNDFSAPTPLPAEEKPSEPPRAETPPEDTTPDWQKDPRFTGDPTKVYSSLKELESKLGQQGKEIGEYRQFFDTYLRNQMQQKPAPAPESTEPSPEDSELLNQMLGKPKQFVERLRNEFYQGLQQMASQNAVAQIKREHGQVLQDPAFSSWLQQNVPFTLAQEADRDPRALSFVLNQYQMAQTPAQSKQHAQEELATKAQKVQAAAGVGTTGRPSGEKVWSRREIMKLQMQNPDEYARLARPGGAIYEAYANGRIKE